MIVIVNYVRLLGTQVLLYSVFSTRDFYDARKNVEEITKQGI